MPEKSALEEYNELLAQRRSYPVDPQDPVAVNRHERMMELWLEIQQEIGQQRRQWLAMHSQPNDRETGITILKELIPRLQKHGFSAPALRLMDRLFCIASEGEPSLLDRLRRRDESDKRCEWDYWQLIFDAIAAHYTSRLLRQRRAPKRMAQRLQDCLDELEGASP